MLFICCLFPQAKDALVMLRNPQHDQCGKPLMQPMQVAILLETGTAGPLGVLMRKITEGDPVLYWVYIYNYIYIYIGFAIFFGLG